MNKHQAIIALGSNLGDKLKHLEKACYLLKNIGKITKKDDQNLNEIGFDKRVSSTISTSPTINPFGILLCPNFLEITSSKENQKYYVMNINNLTK